MGWKNLKEHYRISHIVQMRRGALVIGSPYISDLITVHPDGTATAGKLGVSSNDDLSRYLAEMQADPALVARLLAAPDTFAKSLPVFTYDGGNILEKQCEEYDWPNLTHDGLLMYENTFSADKAQVIAWAKQETRCGIENMEENLKEAEKRVTDVQGYLARYRAQLAKLEADYPTP